MESDLNNEMSRFAEKAIEVVSSTFGKAIDYTPQSVEVIEEMLAKYHKEIPKNFLQRLTKRGLSEETIRIISTCCGAYIAEVIKREWGGHWSKESNLYPGTVTFHVQGSEQWPQMKAAKRIINGPEDNVYHYFQMITSNLERKA